MENLGCDMRGGGSREKIYYYEDGTSTRTYIDTGLSKPLEMKVKEIKGVSRTICTWSEQTAMIEVPPKRPPSPDCKIL